MTLCERCGKEIPEQRTSCPSCGTSLFETQASNETITDPILPTQKKTNTFPFDSLYEEYIPQLAPIYERNYAARSANLNGGSTVEIPPTEQVKTSTTAPVSNAYTSTTFNRRFFHVNTRTPLLIEAVLTLFTGIFGVGWLLIGKKRIGTLLLAGSIIFYLPLLIISYGLAYFSYGLSILCTGPLAIGAVLLNAFMLHKTMQRKIPERSPGSPGTYQI